MQITASLNNLRIAPRKVRAVVDLVRGMTLEQAQAQLAFLVKKPAPLILKLMQSAAANAKNNFDIEKENLAIKQILVEAGPSLKRWLPRAMGRATPILKRTCSVKLTLEEIVATGEPKAKKAVKPQVVKSEDVLPETERPKEKTEIAEAPAPDKTPPQRPYNASGKAKSGRHSRQTFGNIKKMFRRKSI